MPFHELKISHKAKRSRKTHSAIEKRQWLNPVEIELHAVGEDRDETVMEVNRFPEGVRQLQSSRH